jgi:hypothetical protein
MFRLVTILILILLSFINSTAQSESFNYFEINGNTVKTTHQAKYKIKIDKSFKFLGEFHHQPTYGEKQFNVSLAVFTDGENIIMIHAEIHTDGSGGLDYSDLSPAILNKIKFTSREQCASAEDEAELSANPQIKFVRDKGFDMKLPFYLKQFFTTSDDGKAEVVISYGRKVNSCDELKDDFEAKIKQEIIKNIEIETYK